MSFEKSSMIVRDNIDITNLSTMRLQSVCEILYTPENEEELVALVQKLNSENLNYYIIGGGSNVLLGNHISKPIIELSQVNKEIDFLNGIFYCGCSVKIQKFIRYAQEKGYGGIEFLYSLPALMGGIVYQNAGRGRDSGECISQFLESVTYLDNHSGRIVTEFTDANKFGYRHSPYQDKNCIILGCHLRLKVQEADVTEKKIRERISLSKKHQDCSFPNCGSAFCVFNRYILKIVQLFGMRSGHVSFSRKTSNWIVNKGDASISDVETLIKKIIRLHKLFGSQAKLEFKIFK